MKEKLIKLVKQLTVYLIMFCFVYSAVLLIGLLTTFNIHFWEWKIFNSWGGAIVHIVFNVQLFILSSIYYNNEIEYDDL